MRSPKTKIVDQDSLETARAIARAAIDKKASDVVILDVRESSGFTDSFVIMSGRSTRHTQGLAQAIDGAISAKRLNPARTEGFEEGQWILLDFSDVVVHIFYEETRAFYDLEGLWHDAARIDIGPLDEGGTVSRKRGRS